MANLVDRNFAGGSIGVATSLIELEQISKQYGRRPVLEDVSFTIEKGTVTALIGRNGSGKSTLLSILAGLVHISSGKLSCKDPNLRIGYAPEMFGVEADPRTVLAKYGSD